MAEVGRSRPDRGRFSATGLRNVEQEIETREEIYPAAIFRDDEFANVIAKRMRRMTP